MLKKIIGISALMILTAPAHAALVSAIGPLSSLGAAPVIIPSPPAVLDATVINRGQQGFDEKQGVVLSADYTTDTGMISKGTIVDSHMIFMNRDGTSLLTHGNEREGVVWTFDSRIIGVMSDTGGFLEAASTPELGAPGTAYPGAFSNRGLEVSGRTDDWYDIISPKQIMVTMRVTQPGDWIRVVTQVPIPAALPLFGSALGLLGFAGWRRRQQAIA